VQAASLAKRVIPLKGFKHQVMRVHMLARLNRLRRKTDDLAIPAHRITLLNRLNSHFMAGWDGIKATHPFIRNLTANRQRSCGDDNIIDRIKT